jgi:hypothetical protein
MITHSAGDIEDYPLFAHAPSVSVHFCQPGNVNKPFSLWKHKSKFASDVIGIGSIKARKLSDTHYLVAFGCINEDGTLNEEVLRAGLFTIFKRAADLNAIVYFQYRSTHFNNSVRDFISGYAGAVVCYLSKVDNRARQ